MDESQNFMVRQHLIDFGSITPKEAWITYGIYRLSDVIFKLRKRGMNIKTYMCDGENQFGHPCRYARYVLEEKDNG